MVADSLLYDERCHLPRTTPGPKAQPEPELVVAHGQHNQQQQQQQGGAAANGAAAVKAAHT
jgi:hypothetical protein